MRRHFSSGSPYESRFGISRGVRVGRVIAIAGTAPIGPDGRTVGTGDAALQAKRCLEIIAEALVGLGASVSQVVRTRIMLTRMDDVEVAGEAASDQSVSCRTPPSLTIVFKRESRDSFLVNRMYQVRPNKRSPPRYPPAPSSFTLSLQPSRCRPPMAKSLDPTSFSLATS